MEETPSAEAVLQAGQRAMSRGALQEAMLLFERAELLCSSKAASDKAASDKAASDKAAAKAAGPADADNQKHSPALSCAPEDLQTGLGASLQTDLGASLPTDLGATLPTDLGATLPTDLGASLQTGLGATLQTGDLVDDNQKTSSIRRAQSHAIRQSVPVVARALDLITEKAVKARLGAILPESSTNLPDKTAEVKLRNWAHKDVSTFMAVRTVQLVLVRMMRGMIGEALQVWIHRWRHWAPKGDLRRALTVEYLHSHSGLVQDLQVNLESENVACPFASSVLLKLLIETWRVRHRDDPSTCTVCTLPPEDLS